MLSEKVRSAIKNQRAQKFGLEYTTIDSRELFTGFILTTDSGGYKYIFGLRVEWKRGPRAKIKRIPNIEVSMNYFIANHFPQDVIYHLFSSYMNFQEDLRNMITSLFVSYHFYNHKECMHFPTIYLQLKMKINVHLENVFLLFGSCFPDTLRTLCSESLMQWWLIASKSIRFTRNSFDLSINKQK